MEPIYIDARGRLIFERNGQYFVGKRTVNHCIDCNAEIPRNKDLCGSCAAEYGFVAEAR